MRAIDQSQAAIYTSLLFASIAAVSSPARATDFTAGVLMEKMDAEARAPYVAGVIEGLAYARYARDNENIEGDKKTVEGMKCIYNWFYEKKNALDQIYVAFGRYPSYPPAAIIANMIRPTCGK